MIYSPQTRPFRVGKEVILPLATITEAARVLILPYNWSLVATPASLLVLDLGTGSGFFRSRPSTDALPKFAFYLLGLLGRLSPVSDQGQI